MPETARQDIMTESRFNMWRTVFALAHADNIVTKEERKYLQGILAKENFSDEQRKILEADIESPKNIPDMFSNISAQDDRSQFFYHARQLVWCDGDFGAQEQAIMTRLSRAHIRTVDFAHILDHSNLQLDETKKTVLTQERESILSFDKPKGLVGRMIDKVKGRS